MKTKITFKGLMLAAALLLGGASSAWADATVIYQKGITGYAWATTDFDGTSEGSWTGDVSAASISEDDPEGLKISSKSEGKSISKTITYSSNHLLIYDIVWQIGYASQYSSSNIAKLTIGDVVEFQYNIRTADLYAKVIIAGTTYNIPKYYSNNDNWTIHAEIDTYNKKLVALTVAGLKQKETKDATDESAFNYNLTDLTTYSTIALASNASFSSLALSFDWGKGTVDTQIKSVVVSETPLYAYGINWKSGDTDMGVFKSGYDVEDANVSIPYYRYLCKDNVLYKISTGNGKDVPTCSFTLSSNPQTEYMMGYTAQGGYCVYCEEAENIEGMTDASTYTMTRCSGSKAAYCSEDITLTTLPAGTYTAYIGLHGNGAAQTFTLKVGAQEFTKNDFTSSTREEWPKTFTITEKTDIKINGGNSGNAIDNIYIMCASAKVAACDNLGYTFSSPYALDFNGTGINAYIAKYTSGDVVTLHQVNKVPANTGLYIKSDTELTNVSIPTTTEATDDVTGNVLVAQSVTGTVAQTIETKTNYVLGKKKGVSSIIFAKVPDAGVNVPAGKAYLSISSPQNASSLDIVFDDMPTSIDATLVNNEKVNSDVYDLQGRRVAQPTKGLYIVNGKKVVIK